MLFLLAVPLETRADSPRFEEICRVYRRQMTLVAYRVLHDMAEAEDAVQNALMGISRNMGKLPADNERAVRAYVLTAARNAAVSLLPKKQQRDEILDIDRVDASAEEDLFRRVAASEDYDALLRAIRRLDVQYREVLMLVYVHEHSIQEAAQILHRPEGTVRQQRNRGRKKLIELCRKEGILDEWI